MAKKRKTLSAMSSMPGALATGQDYLDDATTKLKALLSEQGVDVGSYLSDQFGIGSTTPTRTLTTSAGRTVTFYEAHLSYEDVLHKTKIDSEINERDQDSLTPERCSDLDTMKRQQWHYAIGAFDADGRIIVIDGSRRRLMYLHHKPDYDFMILVTQDSLSQNEAREFALEIQTAKSHNARDLGMRLLKKMELNPELSYSDIAQSEGKSKSVIFKRVRAARIPGEVIAYFPLGITTRQFDELYALLFEAGEAENLKYPTDRLKNVLSELRAQEAGESDTDYSDYLIKGLRASLKEKPANDTPKDTPLLDGFNDKKRKATKSVSRSGITTLKLKGVGEDKMQAIEEQIKRILSETR